MKGARCSLEGVVGFLREASRPAAAVVGIVTDLARPRRARLAENVLLRQQLLVLGRQARRPVKTTRIHRLAMLGASVATSTWNDSMWLVKPETLLRWHRDAFRLVVAMEDASAADAYFGRNCGSYQAFGARQPPLGRGAQSWRATHDQYPRCQAYYPEISRIGRASAPCPSAMVNVSRKPRKGHLGV